MRTQPDGQPVFDPLDPAFLDDPYPFYELLRDAGPAVRLGAAQWVIARHAQVWQLLRDPRLRSEWPADFQQMRIGPGAGQEFLLRSVLHSEGERHSQLRKLLGACMRVVSSSQLRQEVGRLVDERLDQALDRGRLEVMEDLALPVPVAVACEMIGIPPADRPRIQEWGIDIIRAFNVVTLEPDRPLVNQAVEGLRGYLAGYLGGRAGSLSPAAAAIAGLGHGAGCAPDDLVDNIIFLLVSGFTTTVHAIAGACAVLVRHPGIYAELRADRSLLAGAVEEFLRYDAPIQHISRFAAAKIDVGGQVIRPGRVVHLLLGSANRDSRQFAGADTIDIHRSPNPHVSFGGGIHACLGASLGRMETAMVIEGMLGRCRFFECLGEPVRRPLQVFRSYERIPAAVAAA